MTDPEPTARENITVLLVDDHAVVRQGCRRLLERAGGIEVIGEAASGEAACRAFEVLAPRVVVLDLSLPDISGLEACRRILARAPGARVLVFSMHDDPVHGTRALEAGARGYVTKYAAPDVLVQAVLAVAAGRTYLSQDMAQTLAMRATAAGRTPAETLTPREFEVFRMLAAGKPVAAVADALCLSAKTIANYQSNIRLKLEVSNATQAVRVAMAHGLLPQEPMQGRPGGGSATSPARQKARARPRR